MAYSTPSCIWQSPRLDNGIGFNEKNYKSFETPFSKINKEFGCKGIGRFTVLAAFENLRARSNYFENGDWHYREFEFNSNDELKPIKFEISRIYFYSR